MATFRALSGIASVTTLIAILLILTPVLATAQYSHSGEVDARNAPPTLKQEVNLVAAGTKDPPVRVRGCAMKGEMCRYAPCCAGLYCGSTSLSRSRQCYSCSEYGNACFICQQGTCLQCDAGYVVHRGKCVKK
eukprot:Nk52_evm20s241 gene=Nk52_evmTU20s241